MAWTQYNEPLEILNAEDMTNIAMNEDFIYHLFKSKGFTPIGTLENVTVTKDFQMANMWDLFNKNRLNLSVLSNSGLIEPYFTGKTIGDYAPNKWDIWEWIQVLNDLHDILTGVKGQWSYLFIDDGFYYGYALIDDTFEKKKIICIGDVI